MAQINLSQPYSHIIDDRWRFFALRSSLVRTVSLHVQVKLSGKNAENVAKTTSRCFEEAGNAIQEAN